MGATQHVRKWGSSLAVRIPKAIAEQWGVSEGLRHRDAISQGDRVVMRKRAYDLADMLSRMTPDNLHPEHDTGRGPRQRTVVEVRYVPDTGDIVWLAFSPQAGHEQAGHRPALVLSPRSYNEKSSLALLCPITSRGQGLSLRGLAPPPKAPSPASFCRTRSGAWTGGHAMPASRPKCHRTWYPRSGRSWPFS